MPEPEKLIPVHGGYRRLKSFQVAQLVYDVTARFCDRYIEKRSRTRDLMVQAARSEARFKLVSDPSHTYYRALREKLGWGGRLKLNDGS